MSVPVEDAERVAIQAYYERTGRAADDVKRLKGPRGPEALVESWTLMRAAGVLGQTDVMLQAAAQIRSIIKDLRTRPDAFNAQRRQIAMAMMDLGRPGFASDDFLRFQSTSLPMPMRKGAARANRARKQLDGLFAPINRFMEGAGDLQPLENADLGLIAPLHLIAQAGDGELDLPATLIMMLSMTADMATAAGLTVSLIPDYLFSSMKRRPDHILSFHTSGHLPGFVHFRKADLPDYILIDKGGYSGWSTLSGKDLGTLDLPPLAEAKEVFDRLYHEVVGANVSKYRQPGAAIAEEPLPPRYVFVALQGLLIDAAPLVRFHTKEMLQLVIDRFYDTDVAVVVKLHPRANDQHIIGWLIEQVQAGTIILREDSIHTLVAGSEAVMTINSGVGSEAMLHRKPIYCFGACDYDPVVHRIASAEQFKTLTSPIQKAVSDDDLVRFIAFYRTRYLIDRAQPGRLESALRERVIDPILQSRQR